MKNARSIVAGNLKKARGEMTQASVAKALGISQAVLSKIESRIREPTAAELKSFAELYRRPVEFFFREPSVDIRDVLRIFFKKNARSFNIELAFLYGSFARGLPNEGSDIDIAVIFDSEKISDGVALDIISDISVRLSKKFKRDANVIVIRPDNWKPMLYYNVIVLGELLFAKDKERYLSIRWDALCRMEDFVSMGLAWQIAAAKASLLRSS